MNGSEDGLSLELMEAEVTGVHIHSRRYGAVVSNGTVNFNDCTFSSSPVSGAGISLDRPSTIAFTRCLIVGNKYGIISKSMQPRLNVTDCTFRNNSASAIHLVHSYIVGSVTAATVLLRRNLFTDNLRAVHVDQKVANPIKVEAVDNVFESVSVNPGVSHTGVSVSGVYVNLAAAGNQAHVVLRRNSFRNLPHSAVSISRCYRYPRLQANQTNTVVGNNFTSVSQTVVVIQCAETATTLIQKNTFLQNRMDAGPSCLSVSSRAVDSRLSVELRIDNNEFRDNSGTHIASLTSARSSFSPEAISNISEFVSNTLVDNSARNSTVYSEYSGLPMHFNTFSNQRIRFELRVGFPSDQTANCTYNWWGVGTADDIAARIFDHSDMAGVGSVIYVPFLNSSQFNCDELSDCSGHGSCIYHDTCRCDVGWSGVDCSSYSCLGVYDCSNRGQCVGPNLCRCDTGWLQPDCSRASCIQQNNCSSRGVCSLPNV